MTPLREFDRFRIGDELHARFALPNTEPFPILADAVYDLLWKRIVNLEFPPGTRLSEETLARELGVSRTPVREALLRLGQVGLVRVSARRGMSIPTITRQDVIELYDLRAAIESYAARRAVSSISEEEISSLRERQRLAHERANSDSAAAADAFFHADLALHEILQKRGGNRRSVRLLADVMGQLSLLSLRAALTPDSRLAAIAEHQRILDALARQDAGAAAEAMEDHIEAVKNRSLADLERLHVGT
ncbi:MAG TPA: GntR family transcriptional regulator [Thermomicrobiales bacterium]